VEPSSITDSKQVCFAAVSALIFQKEGDGRFQNKEEGKRKG
jgi:hypothetical protein